MESIEQQLTAQADRLTNVPIETQTTFLLDLHQRRVGVRRVATTVAGLAVVVLLALFVRGYPSAPPKAAPRLPEPTIANSEPSDVKAIEQMRALREMVKYVSMRSGAQAELVMLKNADGKVRPAIYVPERLVPVRYENLDPVEQTAVRRVLNTNEPLGSI